MEKDGEYFLRYMQDGDQVSVRMDCNRLSMERKGNVTLSLEFSTQNKTQMKIENGTSSGTVPIETEKYFFSVEEGVFYKLKYRLCYPTQEQQFVVKANIKVISEEK